MYIERRVYYPVLLEPIFFQCYLTEWSPVNAQSQSAVTTFAIHCCPMVYLRFNQCHKPWYWDVKRVTG